MCRELKGVDAGQGKPNGPENTGAPVIWPNIPVIWSNIMRGSQERKKASDFSEVSYSNEPEVPVFDENEALRVRILTKW